MEAGSHVVDAHQTVTAERALKLLKGGVEAGAARKATKQEIAGQQVVEPLKAYNKLQDALKLVKGYFGKNLKIDLNDIQFRKFHGDMVGESTKDGTYVDPIMLMHPGVRLAHVIAHELAHRNKEVMNEGLVEGYVHMFFGHDDAEHGYEEAVAKFGQFARRFNKKKGVKKSTERIYELYYSGRYEQIYKEYAKNHIDGLKNEGEKDRAFELFREVFPELHYVESGDFEMKQLKEAEGNGQKSEVPNVSQDDGKKDAQVIDMAAYRNRVTQTEEEIKRAGKRR